MTGIHTFTIRGTRPLLMHNGRLSDPLDPMTKKLKAATGKAKKSDEAQNYVGQAEHEGSLYWDPELGPYLPVDNLQACLIEGARQRKQGKIFEAFVEVVVPEEGCEGYKLVYAGPRDPAGLFAAEKFRLRKNARVGQARVMRTRPRFPVGWKCSFDVEIVAARTELDVVVQALTDAGSTVGIGDWTPRYGRFVVESVDGKSLAADAA